MKDPAGRVIYVGKAKKLRNRLVTYFQQSPHPEARVELMVLRADRFDVILTETETEALILEAELIKKHRPRHNIRLRDDKAYPYIRIQMQEDFPRLEWTRRVKRDGARYYGPFPSAFAARQVLRILNETYRLRDCSENTFRHRSRPCILHQMGKCSAPCVRRVAAPDYKETLRQVVRVLEGRSDAVVKELRRGMEEASDREEFEAAAEYRDQIRNLEIVTQTQAVQQAGSSKDRDVFGLARRDSAAHVAVLRVRGGKLLAVQHFELQNMDASWTDAELIGQVLEQYFAAHGAERLDEGPQAEPSAELRRASEVLVPAAPEDPDWISRSFGVAVGVAGPQAADQQLLALARSNADYALEQKLKRAKGHGVEALEQVQEKLGLAKLPHRIECYDNSNIQGEDPVASRVVFIDGAPDKNLYRRYKIRTVEGANDFATMREVLGRRFSRGEEELPDLVVVDGGKGQLAQAVAILEELNIQGVGVVGLAKARTERDFAAAEVKSSMERVFIPGMKNPVPLPPHTGAYKLLVHVRDEAHRFAISYHRLLRGKRSLGQG